MASTLTASHRKSFPKENGPEMNVHHAIKTFHDFSCDEQIDFLVRLAHELTILARDAYEVGGNGLTDPSRLRVVNELQHRVTAFLIALRKDDARRYPDDVLIRTILQHPEEPGLQRQLRDAFERLVARTAVIA